MRKISRYTELAGWLSFCVGMALIVAAPALGGSVFWLHLCAGALLFVSLVLDRRQRRGQTGEH